jgi:thiaminase/transcriptional activator TenA
MTTQDFWNAAASLIAVTEKHPFLVAMVDGTLDLASFKYYVVQDALYLGDFADCLRRLGRNEDIPAEDSKRLEAFAKGAEEAELDLHNSFFKQWDISEQGVEQMPNTLLYTSFAKRIVGTRPHAEGLAALLPCFWVYMHVGKCMLKLREDLGDRYVLSPKHETCVQW